MDLTGKLPGRIDGLPATNRRRDFVDRWAIFDSRLHANFSKPWKLQQQRQIAVDDSRRAPSVKDLKLGQLTQRGQRLDAFAVAHSQESEASKASERIEPSNSRTEIEAQLVQC